MSDIGGTEFVLAGVVMKRLLSGEQTAGQFCLFENRSGGNTRTPIHVHARDDETVYIIEGELTAVIDGRPRRLTAGESLFLPRGIPHQLMNLSGNPSRYLLIGTPALFDRFVEAAGRELRPAEVAGPPMPEEMSVCARPRRASASLCSRIGPVRGDAVVLGSEKSPTGRSISLAVVSTCWPRERGLVSDTVT